MASKKPAATNSNSLNAKRSRAASDDFGTGSLGSIAGSAFEGGGEIPLSSPRKEKSGNITTATAPATEAATGAPTRTNTAATPATATTITSTATKNDNNKCIPSLILAKLAPTTNGSDTTSTAPVEAAVAATTAIPVPSAVASMSEHAQAKPVEISVPLDDAIKPPTEVIVPPVPLQVTSSKRSVPPKKRRKKSPSVDFTFTVDDDDTPRIVPLKDMPLGVDAFSDDGHASTIRSTASIGSAHTHGLAISALDHLDALGAEAGAATALMELEDGSHEGGKSRKGSMDSHSTHVTDMSNGQRMLLEAFMSQSEERHMNQRQRLESWGGVSELSAGGLDTDSITVASGGTAAAAALAVSAMGLENETLGQDGNDSVSGFLNDDAVIGSMPARVESSRMRLLSISSSATEPSISLMNIAHDDNLSTDMQAIVKAAMASVGDTLAEIASAVETAANSDHGRFKESGESDPDSFSSPLLGATSESGSRSGSLEGRLRSSSISSALKFAFDLDAIEDGVKAAEAATGGAIDFASLPLPTHSSASLESSTSKLDLMYKSPTRKNGKDPPASGKEQTPDLQSSLKQHNGNRDMELIRERARAAAGYYPPSSDTSQKLKACEAARRSDKETIAPQTPNQMSSHIYATPITSNISVRPPLSAAYASSNGATPGSAKSMASKGQSSQKWDSMFDSLVSFVGERKLEETNGLSDKDRRDWEWDGNVPTTYKTKDGKALGRWVNNQRSAKSKGTLKQDREDRLVSAGLKWSVLASNSWKEMLEELRIYVDAQHKAGNAWDGNVPTNYRIKTKHNGKASDEDKNLGRWVNRQRSLYQAGKLRPDRQSDLENVGLKWSMLATTSWESMFETLCRYVDKKVQEDGEWDGNVPANFKTTDTPPKSLGRWINRQRSSFVKDRLKPDYIEKLNRLGLKWAVHERRTVASPTTTMLNPMEESSPLPLVVSDSIVPMVVQSHSKIPLMARPPTAPKPTLKAPPACEAVRPEEVQSSTTMSVMHARVAPFTLVAKSKPATSLAAVAAKLLTKPPMVTKIAPVTSATTPKLIPEKPPAAVGLKPVAATVKLPAKSTGVTKISPVVAAATLKPAPAKSPAVTVATSKPAPTKPPTITGVNPTPAAGTLKSAPAKSSTVPVATLKPVPTKPPTITGVRPAAAATARAEPAKPPTITRVNPTVVAAAAAPTLKLTPAESPAVTAATSKPPTITGVKPTTAAALKQAPAKPPMITGGKTAVVAAKPIPLPLPTKPPAAAKAPVVAAVKPKLAPAKPSTAVRAEPATLATKPILSSLTKPPAGPTPVAKTAPVVAPAKPKALPSNPTAVAKTAPPTVATKSIPSSLAKPPVAAATRSKLASAKLTAVPVVARAKPAVTATRPKLASAKSPVSVSSKPPVPQAKACKLVPKAATSKPAAPKPRATTAQKPAATVKSVDPVLVDKIGSTFVKLDVSVPKTPIKD